MCMDIQSRSVISLLELLWHRKSGGGQKKECEGLELHLESNNYTRVNRCFRKNCAIRAG